MSKKQHGNAICRLSGQRRLNSDLKSKEVAISAINAKGQTTTPADIRRLIDAKPGTCLVWAALSDGTLIVRAKTKSILDMAGMIKAPRRQHVSIEDMNPWR